MSGIKVGTLRAGPIFTHPASIEDDAISIGAEIMFEARTVSVADASEAIILINIEKTKF